MPIVELRDPDEARKILLQGLWLQRAVPPSSLTVSPLLPWCLQIAASGNPLPPTGLVADVGCLAFGFDRESRTARTFRTAPGYDAGQLRTYEDYVLGKLYADTAFDRASVVLRRLQGADRGRGLAYTVQQLRERIGFGGLIINPAVIKSLVELPGDEALARGWELLNRDGLSPILKQQIDELIDAARRSADILAPEDVLELESGVALQELGQRVALRQIWHFAAGFEDRLGTHRPRPRTIRREVPTRVMDEDTYPVGGFASIATRGSMESMLHSQLAYMDDDASTRPDLFDVKFLRDELLYYARDENQFLRRRRSFVVVFSPDLVGARFKDVESPAQRIVLVLAMLVAAVRRLTDWLSTDSLSFEFVFLSDEKSPPLGDEFALLELLFREAIANKAVALHSQQSTKQLADLADRRVRRSLCHVLFVSVNEMELKIDGADVASIRLNGPRPLLTIDGDIEKLDGDVLESWSAALTQLCRSWLQGRDAG